MKKLNFPVNFVWCYSQEQNDRNKNISSSFVTFIVIVIAISYCQLINLRFFNHYHSFEILKCGNLWERNLWRRTSLKHCRKIPPLDIFFSDSSSPKLRELANISTSAMLTSLWRKETATSIGMPWVGSITSSSLCKRNHHNWSTNIRGYSGQ